MYKYRVLLLYVGDDVHPVIIEKIHGMEAEGKIKICAVIKPEGNRFILSVIGDDKNLTIDYVFLLTNRYQVGKNIITRWNKSFPDESIIDTRVFRVEGFVLERFFQEKKVIVPLPQMDLTKRQSIIAEESHSIYPKVYTDGCRKVIVGRKSFFSGKIEWGWRDGNAEIKVGDFTSVGWDCVYELGLNGQHDYHRVTTWDYGMLDWVGEYEAKKDSGYLEIGSDVWIGRGCRFKVNGRLIIGDGAVIASDSVVVSDVPPFAIVGGNPAKIIKYRFPKDVIEKMIKIKWWEWDIDKIQSNISYFSDPVMFVERFIIRETNEIDIHQ